MKVLLTGAPHCGKSTLINKVINKFDTKQGFVTNEIPDDNGGRRGFELVDSNNNHTTLAHIDDPSSIRVSRYGVDITALEKFIEPLFSVKSNQLLYIDEIGQMELYSEQFIKLVRLYISASNNFIGTLTSNYEHPLVSDIRANKSLKIIEITNQNRDSLADILYPKLQNSG